MLIVLAFSLMQSEFYLETEEFIPGGVGQRDRGAWGTVSPAPSWWRAQPRSSPGGFGPTPWVLPLIWSPHQWNNLLLRGRLHRPAGEIEKQVNGWLVSGSAEINWISIYVGIKCYTNAFMCFLRILYTQHDINTDLFLNIKLGDYALRAELFLYS